MKKLCICAMFIVVMLLIDTDLFAQCAMCKAAPTSNLQTGGNKASGLNTGILYLMAIPYAALMGIAFMFFKKQIIAKVKGMMS